MALSADKAAVRMGFAGPRAFPVAANVTIYAGALVSIDNAGYARPARTSTTDVACVGVAVSGVVNGAVAGAVNVEVRADEPVLVANSSAGDAIANVDVGASAFLVDDGQVAKTNGTSTRVAGGLQVHAVDSRGVFVKFTK